MTLCPLQTFSYHSHLRSTLSPTALVSHLAQLNITRAALTDRNTMAGCIEFYKAALQHNIHPIIGCTLDCSQSDDEIIVLVESNDGYTCLNRLVSDRQLHSDFSLSYILNRHSLDQLIVISSSVSLIRLAHERGARVAIPHYPSTPLSSDLLECSRRYSAHIVSVMPITHTARTDHSTIRILDAIRTKRRVTRSSIRTYGLEDLQYAHAYWDPATIQNTMTLTRDCDIEFSIQQFIPLHYPFSDHPSKWLRETCLRLLPSQNSVYNTRLEHELTIIDTMGFSDYFCVVSDIVRYAHQHDIPTIGRGSAANSLVSFLLGITELDPIKHDLYFERFLNPERRSPPDIDLDFCWKRRPKIIRYISETYGHDHVCMIGMINRFGLRSAFRDIGRCIGIHEHELSSFSTLLPRHIPANMSIKELKLHHPRCKGLPLEDPPYHHLITMAQTLSNFPRHSSMHPGGMIITKNPIHTYTAQQRSQTGTIVSQHDMFSIEDMGLIKIDILGQRGLSVYQDTIDRLSISTPNATLNDPKTQRLIQTGQTIGCFYIESPGMRNLLQKLNVTAFDELVAATSIIRPGVAQSGMMDAYITAHRSPDQRTYLHPKMKSLLNETYGIMVYQEDVLKVAHKLAGFTLAEGDLLRRAMSGKHRSSKDIRKLKSRFISHTMTHSFSREQAHELWRQLASFSGYSFCKAHSASYSLLSIKCAYLKAHYPAEFMASVLSNQGGFYSTETYVWEAKRLGLSFQLPCINRSRYEHYACSPTVIQLGLMILTKLSSRIVRRILFEQSKKRFSTLEDLITRCSLSKRESEHLIHAGALACLRHSRPCLLRKMDYYYDRHHPSSPPLIPVIAPCYNLPDFPRHTHPHYEYKTLGFSITHHATDRPFRPLPKQSTHKSPVSFYGKAIAIKVVTTKTKQKMAFVSLEDRNTLVEATLFPAVYARYAHLMNGAGPYLVSGYRDTHFGVGSIIVQQLASIDQND